MTNVLKFNVPAPSRGAQRQTQTKVDTIIVTKELIESWKTPPFQRPVRVNIKVLELVEQLKETGGVFPGIITIGILDGTPYRVDGQHRCEAFKLSELEEGFTDVRYAYFDSMAEMAEEFVRLNSQLVKMKPDDILRGLEGTSPPVQFIRKQCPFVGYDQIRRGTNSPVVSMSMLLRAWCGSSKPTPSSGGASAVELLRALTIEEATHCVEFLQLAEKAWGRDPEYGRLWSVLNLSMCMWLYRRTVISAWSPRIPKLTKELFKKCLLALSASDYVEWLVGRNLSDRDRSPCYRKIKSIFVRTIERELEKKIAFPQPEWVSN